MPTLATLRQTTSPFPPYEGTTADGFPVYIRYKHGERRVHIGRAGEAVAEIIGTAPLVCVEMDDDHRSELDWIEIEPLTGIALPPPDDGVLIDNATAADAEEIAALMRQVRDTTLPYLPKLHDDAEDLVFVRELTATSAVRVARTNRIVGFCARRPGWVDQLYVEVGHHGRQIGSRLLGEALLAVDTVDLWTFQRNEAAWRFYLRRGFTEVERTDGSRNEEHEPDVRLRWSRGVCA